jgi:Transposase IS4
LSVIIRETNREAERYYSEWNSAHPDSTKNWKEVDWVEFRAFLGLLLLAGVYHGSHESLHELWSPRNGRPIFLATMNLKRFKCLLRFCRFDNKATRPQRRAIDKLAAIRDVWLMFVVQLKKFYTPSTDLTVDEQLVPFRGKCPFRQYIPSKPAKYGVKIWWCCDGITSYPLNAEIYLGRQPNEQRDVDQGSRVVKTMISPWCGSGRNIVGDNLFTSVSLADHLLTQGLTYVGTMRKNKRDIPPQMLTRDRAELSSMFAFHENKTLVSYVPKKGKSVVLLSTLHHDKHVDGPKQKPDIILHYNDMKGGVDNMDHLLCMYSCKRKINRWPMIIFFNMIDVAALASYIVWISHFPEWRQESKWSRRRQFLVELGESLVKPEISRRAENPATLRQQIKAAMSLLGFVTETEFGRMKEKPSSGQARCHLCPRQKDRKVRKFCDNCSNAVCGDHSQTQLLCDKCK